MSISDVSLALWLIFRTHDVANGAAIQDYLQQLSGQRTVPNIFIKGQHLGGCDDLFAAKSSGKLEKLLA